LGEGVRDAQLNSPRPSMTQLTIILVLVL
jgi:hypothetical protein